MQGKSNLVTTIDDYSNLYVPNWTFDFLDLDPIILVLKLDIDMVVTY